MKVSQCLFVGARLAGESALKDAFAGKPGSYKKKRFARFPFFSFLRRFLHFFVRQIPLPGLPYHSLVVLVWESF